MTGLQDQVIVVVGASSGMGRETARTLARAGANVVAVARRADRLESLRAELQAEGFPLTPIVGDAGAAADVDRLVAETLAAHGRVDSLVYATGTNIRARALDVLSRDDWELMLRTNLTGAFLCTQAVLPAMRRQQGGLIIYVSTGAVQYPDASGVAYQASKHGLNGLAFGTRVEEKKYGVRTTIVYPGLSDTEILLMRPVPTPKEILDKALLPRDVANVVRFLCEMDPRCHVPEIQIFPARV